MPTPYKKILKMMRSEGIYYNPVPPAVGRILSVDPLRVLFRGNSLDDDEIKIDKSLKTDQGYSFEVGSEVLILPADKIFVVVCEVV